MTFPVLGGNSAIGGYAIDNSLRFNNDDSAYLTWTPSSAGNRKTWTFSVWLKLAGATGTSIISVGSDVDNRTFINWNSNTIYFQHRVGASVIGELITSQVLRDSSAWYHLIVAVDSTQATASNRIKFYINGEQVTAFSTATYFAQNTDTFINNNIAQVIGKAGWTSASYFDGYMAEINFIDGQALSPTDFGEFDEDSGIWKPIQYTGSYGTNGFYLDFENSGSLGADQSGNGNNFTPTNLTSTDQTTDTPTNNFATLNPLIKRVASSPTFSEGNCKVNQSSLNGLAFSTISVSSGKWYVEVKIDALGDLTACGIIEPSAYVDGNPDTQSITYQYDGQKKNLTTLSAYGASYTTGDIIGIAFDADNGTLSFYKNGVSQGTAFTGLDTTTEWIIGCLGYNGSASSNYGNPPFSITSGNSDGNGYGNFEYAPPSGYLALCTQNLATALSPTIDDGSQYFNPVLYTGDGSNPRSLTGVGFQPDFTWIKNRTDVWGHGLADSTRGGGKTLISNSSAVEQTNYTWGYLDSFDSDGFTVDAGASGDDFVNQTSDNYVSWNWLAGGGSVSNSDGSISSQVNVNQTAGFSIVTYTGNQTNGATVGHGLGTAPKVVIVKERNGTSGWIVKHTSLTDAGYYLILNATDAQSTTANVWNDTDPSSTVFTLGDNTSVNENALNYVAYCFAEIEGYSKFGKYTGNGSTDGTFIYTGFRPAMVILKRTDSATDWRILDSTRDTYNPLFKRLLPSTAEAEFTNQNTLDFFSNGFKCIATNVGSNSSGGTYIYLAFAENPFVSSTGIPVTAR